MQFKPFTCLLLIISALCLTSLPAYSNVSAAIIINSGSTNSQYYQAEEDTGYPVYNIGLYEATSNHGWRYIDGIWQHFRERGTATIYIEEQGSPYALALGSYEPIDWILEGPGVDNVTKILLYGYHHHTVVGQPSSTTVIEKTYYARTDDGYLYAAGGYKWPHGATGGIQQILGYPVSSFAGSYQATQFIIESTGPSIPPLIGNITFADKLNSDSCVEASSTNGATILFQGSSSLEDTSFEWTKGAGETVHGSELTLAVGLDEIKEVSLQLTALDGRITTVSKSVCVTDTTPPSIHILSPLEGEVFTGNNMILEVNVSDTVEQNISTYTATVGSLFSSELSDGYSKVKLSKPVRGNQELTTITVKASDSSGNTATASVDIYKTHDNGKNK